jgi:hypothetical protein
MGVQVAPVHFRLANPCCTRIDLDLVLPEAALSRDLPQCELVVGGHKPHCAMRSYRH